MTWLSVLTPCQYHYQNPVQGKAKPSSWHCHAHVTRDAGQAVVASCAPHIGSQHRPACRPGNSWHPKTASRRGRLLCALFKLSHESALAPLDNLPRGHVGARKSPAEQPQQPQTVCGCGLCYPTTDRPHAATAKGTSCPFLLDNANQHSTLREAHAERDHAESLNHAHVCCCSSLQQAPISCACLWLSPQ
jgi:hypothetical protein